MKIAVIGATGFVGKAITKELLSRNYEVTAISRNTEKLGIDDENLTKKDADIYKTEDLANILRGHDAIISAFNPGWENPQINDEVTKGSKAVEQAVEASGVKRFIMIGGGGTLKIDGKFVVDGEHFPKDFYGAANALRNYFVSDLSQNTVLDWSFFSPAIEMHQGITTGRTGKFRVGSDSPIFDSENRSKLSVEDLAVAVVDELENGQFIRKQFTAGY